MKVVYTTNTGSTERYAKMLAEKLGCECQKLSAAERDGEEVVFLGWVMTNKIQGLSEAREKFGELKAVCAVGMLGGNNKDELVKTNAITEPFFSLKGCFNIDRLTGMYKMVMKMMLGMMKKQLKDSTDPADAKALEMIETGVDMVKEENLDEILAFLNGADSDKTE